MIRSPRLRAASLYVVVFLIVTTVVAVPAVMERKAEVEYQELSAGLEQSQQLLRRAEFYKKKADDLLAYTRKNLKELRARKDSDDPKVRDWIAGQEAQLPERYADQETFTDAYWSVAKVKSQQEQRLKALEQMPRLPLTSFYVRMLWALGAGTIAVVFAAAVSRRFSRVATAAS
jgi:hypothetical protein